MEKKPYAEEIVLTEIFVGTIPVNAEPSPRYFPINVFAITVEKYPVFASTVSAPIETVL